MMQYLQHGTPLVKYGYAQKPKMIFAFTSADRKFLCFCDRARVSQLGTPRAVDKGMRNSLYLDKQGNSRLYLNIYN